MLLLKFIKRNKEVFFLLLLSLLFFHKLFFHPDQMIYPASDIPSIYSFWRTFLTESIFQSGTIPLWNPYQFGGMPFIGDTESGIFYPLTLIFFILPVNLAFGYGFVMNIFLLGVFTYIFGRVINMSRFASLISAITMMFSGNTILRIFPGHLFLLDTLIWFPLVLALFEKTIQSKKLSIAFLASIPTAFAVLAGHAQILAYGFFSATLFFYLRLFFERKNSKEFKNKLIFLTPFLVFLLADRISKEVRKYE